MHIFKNKQLAGCPQAFSQSHSLTHTRTHTHTKSYRWRRMHTHKHTDVTTCIMTQTYMTHIFTQSRVNIVQVHVIQQTTHSSWFSLSDIHNFLILISLWCLQANFTSEHNKNEGLVGVWSCYTVHKWRMNIMSRKFQFSYHSTLHHNTVWQVENIYVLYYDDWEWVNLLFKAWLGYMRLSNKVHRNNK